MQQGKNTTIFEKSIGKLNFILAYRLWTVRAALGVVVALERLLLLLLLGGQEVVVHPALPRAGVDPPDDDVTAHADAVALRPYAQG